MGEIWAIEAAEEALAEETEEAAKSEDLRKKILEDCTALRECRSGRNDTDGKDSDCIRLFSSLTLAIQSIKLLASPSKIELFEVLVPRKGKGREGAYSFSKLQEMDHKGTSRRHNLSMKGTGVKPADVTATTKYDEGKARVA